jgi:superfamily I DNA/RNA helicase
VALVDRLVLGDPAPRVRLLTFTRAATGELAKKVSAHPVAAAERPSTIHSFAISTLLRNPGAGDFPEPLRIADSWEYKNIVRVTLARPKRTKGHRSRRPADRHHLKFWPTAS